MLSFHPKPPAISDLKRHIADHPNDPGVAVIAMLHAQPQEVIGRMIAAQSGCLRRSESLFLHWLVDQRLDLANAIRLFWVLFRPEFYLGQRDAIDDCDQRGPDRLHLLRRLSDRIARGYYPRGELGISARQSKNIKIQLVEQTRDATIAGWNQLQDEAFEIPAACLMPLSGRMLRDEPAFDKPPVLGDWDAPRIKAHLQAAAYIDRCLAQPYAAAEPVESLQLRRSNRRAALLMAMGFTCAGLLTLGLAGVPAQLPSGQSFAQLAAP